MAIPQVDYEAVRRALAEFDQTLRPSEEWSHWEERKSQVWALDFEGRLYPPKQITAMATGLPVSGFSGGPETNEFLDGLGFAVRKLRDPPFSETLAQILDRYGEVRASTKFGGNNEVTELFTQARRTLEAWDFVANRPHIHVVGSYGKGDWAAIPWISLLDDRETKTTQSGTYVIYLFRKDGKGLYVKIAQGVTSAGNELGARAARELADRAATLRAEFSKLAETGFDLSGVSDLGTSQRLGKLYEASTIAAKYYPREEIPGDIQLKSDLQDLLGAYESFVARKIQLGEPAAVDFRRLSLIGTWRDAAKGVAEVTNYIREHGAWASWWSFPIKADATLRLQTPFYLYAYEGGRKVGARFRIDEMVTTRGSAGIETPWSDVTRHDWRGKRRIGEKQSEVFKTWFKIGSAEMLQPPMSIADFELAIGLSTPENVTNQNSFGYVIEPEPPYTEDKLAPFPNVPEPPPAQAPDVVPALDISWLEQRTGLDKEFLQELVDAILGHSPQIMLVGPPGTSKTWLARQLSLFVARNQPQRVKFVQFHPSYSYESFMEGLRPVASANGVSFQLTPGVVLDLVSEMRRLGAVGIDGHEFVVVIDEANRANLPRVLGELMFLFEYRDQPVRLQYSGEFSLPSNLRFIATMNTADRSIRSIDVALRRRFDVFEIRPSASILERHFDGSGAISSVKGLVSGFEALNAALETNLDRHHTIGHAFFMRPLMDAATLRQIWKRKVFPLVEEFFFDQPDLTKEFSVEKFWPNVHDE